MNSSRRLTGCIYILATDDLNLITFTPGSDTDLHFAHRDPATSARCLHEAKHQRKTKMEEWRKMAAKRESALFCVCVLVFLEQEDLRL